VPLDDWLPDYDFVERHAISLSVAPRRALEAVLALDFRRSLLVRALFTLRGLRAAPRFQQLLESGFVPLALDPEREIVLGLVGQPWLPTGGLRRLDASGFRAFREPGYVRVAWSFEAEPTAPPESTGATTRLTTETRIQCLDARSRRRFRPYWLFVRPFSGLVRREMLRLVAQRAREVRS
jgi:hypothetical protein